MNFWINILSAGVSNGTALLFATMGELIAERAGVMNLGVEGMMLMGAVTGYSVGYHTGNPWLGLIVGMLAAGLLGLLHAFVVITLRRSGRQWIITDAIGNRNESGLGRGLSQVSGVPLILFSLSGAQ
jgi:simple sugar transport system permease protein